MEPGVSLGRRVDRIQGIGKCIQVGHDQATIGGGVDRFTVRETIAETECTANFQIRVDILVEIEHEVVVVLAEALIVARIERYANAKLSNALFLNVVIGVERRPAHGIQPAVDLVIQLQESEIADPVILLVVLIAGPVRIVPVNRLENSGVSPVPCDVLAVP